MTTNKSLFLRQQNFFFVEDYEYFRGCNDIHGKGNCRDKGKRCPSERQCTDCTLGKCIQLAKEKYSEGFSYTKKFDRTTYCSLCTLEQLGKLETDDYSVVYKRTGKLQIGSPLCV